VPNVPDVLSVSEPRDLWPLLMTMSVHNFLEVLANEHFNLEDRGNIFLQNVGIRPQYHTVSQPRKRRNFLSTQMFTFCEKFPKIILPEY
jgi:hypothetical protein